jgi:hypothetical protein
VPLANLRDITIFPMALGTGLRLAEFVGLNVGDVFAPTARPGSACGSGPRSPSAAGRRMRMRGVPPEVYAAAVILGNGAIVAAALSDSRVWTWERAH